MLINNELVDKRKYKKIKNKIKNSLFPTLNPSP